MKIRKHSRRAGFTLVELVIVVLITGIIAAVALPKMTMSTNTAKTNSAKHSLATIRAAIEIYKVENGSYPSTAASLPTALKAYLKGPFPASPIGTNAGSAAVAVAADPPAVVAGGAGWAFNTTTGEFYLNEATGLAW